MNEKTYIKSSQIHEYGLFATVPIKKGEIVIIFEGFTPKKWSTYLIELEATFLEVTNDAKYANHSDDPNTIIIKHFLIACKNIKKDEEITFNYG